MENADSDEPERKGPHLTSVSSAIARNSTPSSPNNKSKKCPSRISELESQAFQLQEELKRAQDQLSLSESRKKQALQDDESKKQLLAHSSMLEGLPQQFLKLKISQEPDPAGQSELEAGQKHNAVDLKGNRAEFVSHVQALTALVLKGVEFNVKLRPELENLAIQSKALKETYFSQRKQICQLQHQLEVSNQKLKMADLQSREWEMLRKRQCNTILELKGNIRVFCRIRPSLPDDGVGTVISFPKSLEARGRAIELIENGHKYLFTFDQVFTHESSQQDCFVEISQLVQSAIDGYKVCIFAYGQTGSGKTYTMMGRPETSEQKGIIPRSLEQVFQASQSLQAQGWKCKMQASMLEIYNETIHDLLSTNRSSGLDTSRTETSVPRKKYSIKHDANGNTYVSDLTVIDVCTMKEISSLLQQAAQSRFVERTQMNEQSSRSHFVVTLRISLENEGTEEQIQGVLNLVDLAGSERLSKSMSTGDRLKETQAINKSLSSLADVISALAKKEDHVPFRNSKLTYLLQPCLGGDSKTLMFVNISPDPSSVGESLCSLRFAARVNSCEIGIPQRQTTVRPLDSPLNYD